VLVADEFIGAKEFKDTEVPALNPELQF